MPLNQSDKSDKSDELNPELYFDWAATAVPDQDILRAALLKSLECWGNPSSVHAAGKAARAALEKAREKCAGVLGCEPRQIYFTSGGTESDHIALLSVLNRPQKGNVLVSSIEHPALREMAAELKHVGIETRVIPADRSGIITPEAVRALIDEKTLFVTVMAVNNETGVVQPVREIADAITEAAAGKRRPKFHVDCVQALGKIPLDFSKAAARGIDSAAFSAHKISGPRGIGILYSQSPIEPFLKGGGQEGNVRSGTENLFGALAMSECMARHAIKKDGGALSRYNLQKSLCADFIRRLKSIPACSIIPASREEDDERFSPWIVQAAFKNIPGQVMLRALDAKGICISTGSACSSKKASRPVLEAMNVGAEERENSVRFSFGPSSTEKGMDALFEVVKEVCGNFSS